MNNIIFHPWAKALGIVAVAIAIILAISAYNGWLINIGKTTERAEWLKRDNDALTTATARIKALTDAARAKEQAHAKDLAAISDQHQKDLSYEQAKKDRVIADLRSGARRLRIELAATHPAGGSAAAQAGPGPGRCDGATTAELSQPAAEFLVGLASECDAVVHQLTACQAVVTKDRQLQGEK